VDKRSTWVAWSMLASFIVVFTVGVALSAANGNVRRDPGEALTLPVMIAAFMVVGCLIVARRPTNVVGWTFTAVGLVGITGGLAEQYAQYAYVTRPGSLPGPVVAAWLTSWIWGPITTLMLVFTLLLFPTGRPPSVGWRPVAWIAVAATAAVAMLDALTPSLTLQDGPSLTNPIAVPAADSIQQGPVGVVLDSLVILSAVAAVISLMVRFRRSRGEERQQLKWFTYAAALVLLTPFSYFLPVNLGDASFSVVIVLPIAVGIAITRHRLYDIDRLINRTLVYGLLTFTLGLGYAGTVLVLGELFGGVADNPPSWAVAGATLAVAALFRPARRRIQEAVDRRFNRRKYNASQTVEAFSARLRDQVDLDTLSREVLAVVDQTMQPTTVSLWLRPYAQGSRRIGT
jgi:MFS family permease